MTREDLIRRYDALLAKHGSQRAIAIAYDIPRTTIQEWLKAPRFVTTAPAKPVVIRKPRGNAVKRFIFSSAQTETAVHLSFLRNLEAYAAALGAEIVIGGYSYNKRLFEEHRKNNATYAPEIVPYLGNRRVEIGDNLSWCGEMNTLPTAVSPLTGFEVYTKRKWGIFPHAKVQLLSVPTMKSTPAKILMTTGSVTLPNYVQKRAGIRAHFHHIIGAVLVEIDADGDHFCRHLLAEEDGSFQDLTRVVRDGQVSDGTRVEAITWGDLHSERIDPIVLEAAFGVKENGSLVRGDCMLDWLTPRFQFFHDVTDFAVRNHHNIKDPHFRIRMMARGTDSVADSLKGVGCLLARLQRSWCQSVVVESNHDRALLRWLKEADWRQDPINAEFFLGAQLACVEAIVNGGERFSPLEWALRRVNSFLRNVDFLREDESFPICNGTIECGMHGHLGANGSEGSPRQFTKAGSKANTGHTHSASIIDGVYTAGTSSKLDMGYNTGLSSWSHSHIVTYTSGKRTIVTMQGPKFCAQ